MQTAGEGAGREAVRIMERCSWCGTDPLYVKYHDEEWGAPVHDDRKHFEFLLLESAQAGLSWLTILRKRENYRAAYDAFDVIKIRNYDEDKYNELLSDKGIVRNRLKIRASINNARQFIKVQEEFGSFDKYIWGFTNNAPVVNNWESMSEIPAVSPLAEKVSADLKARGFKFLGPTIVYAHMQATGLINDHITSCFRHDCSGSDMI